MSQLSIVDWSLKSQQSNCFVTNPIAVYTLLLGAMTCVPQVQSHSQCCEPVVQSESDTSLVKLEQALSRFKEAGGVAQWVSKKENHLMVRRFNTKEMRIPLTKLEILTQVKTLTLHGSDFGDDDLKVISHWKHLEGLHLINNRDVTDAGMKYLESMTKLKCLIMWDTKITNAGMKTIAALTTLVYLDIQNSAVGDEGLEGLKECKKLEVVNLFGTNVTKAGVEKLKRSLPNCVIEID